MFYEASKFLVDASALEKLLPSKLTRVSDYERPLSRAFAASSMLIGLDMIADSITETEEVVTRSGKSYHLINGELPSGIWNALPLESHRISSPIDLREPLIRALSHIDAYYPEFSKLVADAMPNIAIVELRKEYYGIDNQITSSSFPLLPSVGFFSRKALKHIPPNTVSDAESVLFLAENLVHEAIHQIVNLSLLTTDVMVAEYSSRESPMVEIKWRYGQGVERNQRWELDRVLHAAAVYVGVASFRRRELGLLSPTDHEYSFFRNAIIDASDVLIYLTTQLNSHRQYFTDRGQELIEALRADARREVDETTNMLKEISP